MRFWLSGPRMFGGLIRPGISFGREDFGRSSGAAREIARLRPGWIAEIEADAKAKGRPVSRDEASALVDAAIASGGTKPTSPLASILVYAILLPVVSAFSFLATWFVIIAIRGN